MFRRVVSEPVQPHRDPHQADQAKGDEHAAPRHHAEHAGPAAQQAAADDEGRRQAGDQVRAGEEDALRASALAARNPARERSRHTGPRARLADAEEEPHQEHDWIVERRRRCRGQRRPPDHDARQDGSRADAIRPAAGRDFEQSVGKLKCGEHPSHLDGGQPEIAADSWSQRSDGDAIEIGDHRQRRCERDDAIPRAGSRHGSPILTRHQKLNEWRSRTGPRAIPSRRSRACKTVDDRADHQQRDHPPAQRFHFTEPSASRSAS